MKLLDELWNLPLRPSLSSRGKVGLLVMGTDESDATVESEATGRKCKFSNLSGKLAKGRVLGTNVADLGWMSDIEGLTLMLRIIADPAIERGVMPQDTAGNLLNKLDLWKRITKETNHLSPVQLLRPLENGLVDEFPALHFDYNGMNERSWKLLNMIQVDLGKARMISEDGAASRGISVFLSIVLGHLDHENMLLCHAQTHPMSLWKYLR